MKALRALGRLLWWFWIPGRIRALERAVAVMKSCPCCGAVMVLGHPRVSVIEVSPGERYAVCRWGKAEIQTRAQIAGFKKARVG